MVAPPRPALVLSSLVVVALTACDPAVSVDVVDTDPECAGLLPAAPHSHVNDSFDIPAASVCLNGTSDGASHLALGQRVPATEQVSYHAETDAAVPLAVFSGTRLAPLLPQPDGYHSVKASLD